MMFTPDPCFNEPGYEGIKGTDEGDVSNTYNLIMEIDSPVCESLSLKISIPSFFSSVPNLPPESCGA